MAIVYSVGIFQRLRFEPPIGKSIFPHACILRTIARKANEPTVRDRGQNVRENRPIQTAVY